ncbi:MAG: IS21 family transposase [Chitinophagaceae bacterium]|nr:IS21 family transposase [Chitinophagaceae bacterium]
MANKTILMSKIRQILRLFTQGKSKVQISEQTGASRNTVKKYIRRFISEKITYDLLSSMSDTELEVLFGSVETVGKDQRYEVLQQMLPDLEKRFKKKGVTIRMLWRQYLQAHPGGYQHTCFHKYFTDYTGRAKPVMHMEHKAGDKMYIDFAGEKLSITDQETGEVQDVEVFVAILGCSQLTYVEAVTTQRREDFIGACENALRYFGGVPAAIVPDNLKSAVTKSSKYEPTINELFADFAEHYGTSILPARVYRPKDKSLVEGMVKIIYSRIYALISTHTYFTIESLNIAIGEALELLNNALLQGRDYSRRMHFEEVEKETLQPLPVYRYQFKQQHIATVMKNGHVCLAADKHYYSVPYRFIGKKVKMLFTPVRIDVYYKFEQIATHLRQGRRYQYTTITEHLASAHRYLSEWTPEKFVEQAKAIDEEVAGYILRVIENKQHPEQAYRSCLGILNLARKVGSERLTRACRRANDYGIYNYPIIVQILERRLDELSAEEQHDAVSMPQHQNIRGSDYYQ